LNAARKASPDYADLHKIHGDLLMHRGEAGAARAAYTQAASLNPDYAEAVFGMVIALRREGRDAKRTNHYGSLLPTPENIMARTLLTVDSMPVGEA
jgi:cytochrome c-type biogenesis protein CcmH/NrfG